jgi:RNA polymerase sigma-70 factor (ECF subfamily)
LPLRRALLELRPALLRRALQLSRSRSTAEDLVQDTMERAMRFEDSYAEGSNLRAWAHQVLFSVFITRCRRLRREQNALSILAADPCAWTTREPSAPMAELSPSVRLAVESLPIRYREAVLLVDLHERPYKEAAAQLGVPIGTIMSRLFRGRRLLAIAMNPASLSASSSDQAAPRRAA